MITDKQVKRVMRAIEADEAPAADYGDFWDRMASNPPPVELEAADQSPDLDGMEMAFVGGSDGIEDFIHGRELGGDFYNSMSRLTDQGRKAMAMDLPQVAGTRVRFVANLGSILTYDNVPDPKVAGTVVTVKTAEGPKTDMEGRVFVAWDDGVFRQIFAEHLRLASPNQRRSSNVRMVVGNLGDISSMFVTASHGDELIHRATKDLWAVKKDGGNFVIERLFDNTGKPLKV